MNTSQIIIAICAIAGFIISLINLGIIIYNNFIKKAKIQVKVKDFYTRFRDFGIYDFQLDCIIHAKHGDIRLKNVSLVNELAFCSDNEFCYGADLKELILRRAIDGKRYDIAKDSSKTFKEVVSELFKEHSFRILDIKVADGDFKHMSFIGELYTVRMPDSYEELPDGKWSLEIEYNDMPKVKLPLKQIILGKKEGVYRHY